MARKSYHRQFRKNGRSFYVQNCFKQDMRKPTDRYYLSMMKDGFYTPVHNFYGRIPYFATIEEAQEHAVILGDDVDELTY